MASSDHDLAEQCLNTSLSHQVCLICDEILNQLTEDSDTLRGTNVLLGSLDETERSPCLAHKSLVQSLQHSLEGSSHGTVVPPMSPPLGNWRPSDILVFSRPQFESRARVMALCVHRQSTDQYQRYEFLLVNKHTEDDHRGVAILLDPDWIDLDRCRGWFRDCLNDHGPDCENPLKIVRQSPRLLVDIKRRCIINAVPEHRYFALSYRIGSAGRFLLRPQNLAELCQEDALRKPAILGSLQLTVQQSLLLADALNATYLWIDVLCVVHGGEASVADQLHDMASIYSSALMTIVVDDGDGCSGIPGLPAISQSRALHQAAFVFRDEQLLLRPEENLTRGEGYQARAWTHQEFIMSPRKLIFRSKQVYWMCLECRQYEHLARPQISREYTTIPHHVLLGGVPDLQDLFMRIISEYNKKELTYPEDALPAALGLLAVFSRTFTGGFLYGLPEILFDAALGWNPVSSTNRRRDSGRPEHLSLGPSYLPSWSWVGWNGLITMPSSEPFEVGMYENPGTTRQETSPITTWFTSDDANDLSPRQICPTWCQDRDNFKDVGQPLPEGWSRHAASGINVSAEFVYQHIRLSRHGKFQFWKYPFPVPVVDASTPLTHPPQTRYLFSRTWKTSVLIHRSTDHRRDFGKPSHGNVLAVSRALGGKQNVDYAGRERAQQSNILPSTENRDEHGPIIGNMYVNGIENWSGQPARSVDIVAISRITESGNRPEHKMIKVLWVEWENGIAYRLGSGEVDEDAWCMMETEGKLEKIDLILG